MQTTKSESQQKLHESGQAYTVDEAVLANIKSLGPICRDALCVAAGVKVSTACGAIDRLKKRGLVEVAADRVWNSATRRNVQAYQVVKGE